MTFDDWLGTPENWVFLVIAVPMVFAAWRVVASQNVVHAVLYLVATLAASAGLFLLLGAEFVAWTLVLVYIGAVIVLFLFGIMITRAPIGREVALSHSVQVRIPAAVVSFALFLLMGGAMLEAFANEPLGATDPTRTIDVGASIFERFVVPFEVVSVVLLAALIGGIVLARRDPDEMTEPLPEDASSMTGTSSASRSFGSAETANVTAEGGDA
jgi:NADH-quinone oxidoreductase subunit J